MTLACGQHQLSEDEGTTKCTKRALAVPYLLFQVRNGWSTIVINGNPD